MKKREESKLLPYVFEMRAPTSTLPNVWKCKVGSPFYSSLSKLPHVDIWSTWELATHVTTWFAHEFVVLDMKPITVRTSSRQYLSWSPQDISIWPKAHKHCSQTASGSKPTNLCHDAPRHDTKWEKAQGLTFNPQDRWVPKATLHTSRHSLLCAPTNGALGVLHSRVKELVTIFRTT